MKRFYFSKLVFLITILLGSTLSSYAQTTTFSVNNATGNGSNPYTYTVPTGCTAVALDVVGANGGRDTWQGYGQQGYGGRVQCNLAVTGGQVLYCYVGGVGVNGDGCCGHAGGYNGGGNSQLYGAAGGGGGTDVSFNSGAVTVRNRVVVAGGGGGGGYGCCCSTHYGDGGVGGGLTGGGGYMCGSTTYSTCYNAGGGTQNSGGVNGSCGCNSAGSLGVGGLGSSCYYGGGGGGGYYGGGGAYGGGGGGGSSFTNPTYVPAISVTHTPGFWVGGDGYISITPLVPLVTAKPVSLSFGPVTVGTLSIPQATQLTGVRLTGFPSTLTVTAPTGYQISTDATFPTWSTTLTIPYSAATVGPVNLYVQFKPAFPIAYCSGVITVTGGGQPTNCTIPVCGTGVAACTGSPSAGTAIVSPTSGGTATVFTLTDPTAGTGGSITYQWQYTLDTVFGTGWTNINGAVFPTSTFTGISQKTLFRLLVTCPTGGTSISSTFTVLNNGSTGGAAPPTLCASPVSANNPQCCGFWVANSSTPFVMNGEAGTKINDNNAAAANKYYFDLTSSQSVTLQMGNSYTGGNGYNLNNPESFQIWIDFNGNGTFETSESVGGWNQTSCCPTFPTVTITIPTVGITPGTYRMRCEVAYNGGGSCNANYPCYPSINPCSTTTQQYSETRDYTAVIITQPCSGVPESGVAYVPVTTGCGSYLSNLYGIGTATGNGITTNWQISPDNSSWSDILPASLNLLTYTQNVTGPAPIYVRNKVTCTPSASTVYTTSTELFFNQQPAAITGNFLFCSATPSALSDATPGGSWSSSNLAVASIGSTGVVTGISGGTATISYTMPVSGCSATQTVTVYLSPSAITGGSTVCTGLTTSLTDATPGGIWTSSFPAFATIGSTGTVTGVAPGTTNITYTIPAGGCYVTAPVTANLQPAAITGTTTVCVGSTTKLNNTSPGGAWSSSNSFQASVVPGTGLVSGVLAGTPVISYTLVGGCYSTAPVTVNPLPSPIGYSTTDVCVGSVINYTDGTGSGTWSSALPAIATVSGGAVTGVTGGTTNIIYTITATGCAISQAVNVHQLPAVYSITGGGGYCAGSGGTHVGTSGSDVGIIYKLYNSNIGFETSLGGSHSGLDFGLMTDTGTYTVVATDATYGCQSNMSGSTKVFINPVPNTYTLSAVGTGFYCAGGTGVDLILSGSDLGVSYQVFNPTLPFGVPVNGTGLAGSLDLGLHLAGSYNVTGAYVATGCSAAMSGGPVTISANPAPAVDTVSGGGSYCMNDTGLHIFLNTSSAAGIDYKLYNGATWIATQPGTGSMLDFGPYTTAGTYSILAVNTTSNCQSNMYGTPSISINPLPTPQIMTGGGGYCAGGVGQHVGLKYSVSGTNYQLYLGGSKVGMPSPVPGSNAGLDFGLQTSGGDYTVIGTNAYGCMDTMIGKTTITVNSLPLPYAISSGGGYCAGTGGFDVNISNSDLGINYQLYNGTSKVGTPKPGINALLDFGNQIVPGTYSVIAVNASTGCVNNMPGTSVVTVNPLPTSYIVSGGGAFCAGTGGKDVTLSSSDVSTSYDLYVTGNPLSLGTLPGTGSSIDFGPQTTSGTYTVIAKTGPGCVKNMAGSATITVNPLPVAYAATASAGGQYCAGGTGVHIYLAASMSGVEYQLALVGTGNVGSPLGGSGKSLDFGIYTAGDYTIQATNTKTGCTNAMANDVNIIANPLPAVYTVTEVGTGAYCAGGAGVDLTLSGSESTASYNIMNSTTHTADGSVIGTGVGTLDLLFHKNAGTYKVVAVNTSTGCSSNMMGSANIIVNPIPTAYLVTGGGHRCAFNAGDTIGLGGSDLNTNYQVYTTGSADGPVWAGTGLPIYLGLHTTDGFYTVVATNPTTTCTNVMTDSVRVTVDATTVPTVAIAANDTVCAGVANPFTTVNTGGGTSPAFSWKVNGVHAGGAGTFSYIPSTGDVVEVAMTSNAICPSPATVTDKVTMTVNPSELPTVAITADHPDQVCPGTKVKFTATSAFGGSAPSYTWIKDSKTVDTGSTYSYTFTGNEVVFCELVSNYACRTTSFVLSNNIAVTTNDPILPAFTIDANPGTTINMGQSLTLIAVISNVGGAYTYQWYVNGVAQFGQTNPTFTYNAYSDMDVVKCVVTSVGACGGIAATQSQMITVRNTTGVAQVNAGSDVRVIPNPNKGTFTVKGSLGTVADQEVTLEITNMLGQVVYTNKVMVQNGNINELIQLSNNLANGMYLLNLRSGADTKVFHFVIEQ